MHSTRQWLGAGVAILMVVAATLAPSGARAVPRGLLRVHATLGFGRRHVTPAVARFADKYPEVEVQLDRQGLVVMEVALFNLEPMVIMVEVVVEVVTDKEPGQPRPQAITAALVEA